MIDSSTELPPLAVSISAKAHWETTERTQEYVDEAVLHYVNGQIYLSLGQIQIPPAAPGETLESVQILPVARLVFTEASFHKVLKMLNRVSASIRKPEPDAGEEDHG